MRLIRPTVPVLLFVLAGSASAQAGPSRPNVFFDCNGPNCNFDYYRTEIGWVNWVRDQQDADVHVIMTSLGTGAGGREYQLDFLGTDEVEAYTDQLHFRSLPTDTDREALDGLVFTLGIGLARYANTAGYRGLVTLEGPDVESSGNAPGRIASSAEVDDPWNLWTFRINANANLDGEETRKNTRLNGNFNASRVTPTWKVSLGGNLNYNHQWRLLSDGPFTDTRVDWGFNQLIVYGIAGHWSVGLQGQFARMTQLNQDFRAEVTPAVEYSFFPYDEATRRSLTVFYTIGPAYRNYIEETVYGQWAETRFEHRLQIELSQRQPWGDASISIEGSHFLDDLSQNNLSLDGNVNFRIVRGLSVNARGNVSWVNDQIYISAEDVTDEEALLDLRRQATDFNYQLSMGVSIQFGSIFNNVVNNRFRGVGGFGGRGGRFF